MRLASILTLVVLAAPLAAQAQELPLKRSVPAPTVVSCPAFVAPATPVREQIDEANRLATLGQEAAIEGDHKSARDLFKQAAGLNQSDATFAYRLGRESEEMRDKPAAVREYCRYLYLSPAASDTGQIRDRLARLLPSGDVARGQHIVEQFRVGLTAYDRGDWGDAADAFSTVATAAPGFGPAYFNRALARAHQHRQPAAIQDFDRYLELTPLATDREAVRQRELALRHELPSASTAFWLGLLPGAGQYYTGQPLLGVVVTGATAGAIVFGLQSQTVTKTADFVDGTGHHYTQTFQVTEHQHLGAGIGAAAGITLLGAIEAAIVAHGRSSGLPPVGDTTTTTATGALPPRFRVPALTAGPTSLGFALSIEFR